MTKTNYNYQFFKLKKLFITMIQRVNVLMLNFIESHNSNHNLEGVSCILRECT